MKRFCMNLEYILFVICVVTFVLERASTETCRTPDGKMGNCVNFRQCDPLNTFLQTSPKPIPQETLDIIRWYHDCGTPPRVLDVCCPNEPIVVDNSSWHHRNMKLLPFDECGPLPSADRISTGRRTALFEFPWMALLSYQIGQDQVFRCAGTIISDRYIMTAAHCLSGLEGSPLIGVRVGEYNVNTTEDCVADLCSPEIQEIGVEKLIVHEEYTSSGFNNDIGLVRLAAPINITVENAKPICLPLHDRNVSLVNQSFFVTGWGLTNNDDKTTYLLKASVTALEMDDCAVRYKAFGFQVTDNQVCAIGSRSENVCEGDSGGPMQTLGRAHDGLKLVQYGIISSGASSCTQHFFPAIYTRVDAYLLWILDNLEE